MATLSPAPTAPNSSGARWDPEQAVHRLTLYFRNLGLPDPQATENAETIVRSVRQERNDSGDDLTAVAVERALETVGTWLDRIAESAPAPSNELRLQLAWHLRPVLGKHAEIFLRSDGLPEEVQAAVHAAEKAVLPPPSWAVMPPQALGDVPRLWYKLAAHGSLLWVRLARIWRRQ